MQHRQLTPAQWDVLATDPDFHALVRARRRFVIPATIVFIAFYFALPLSVGYAPRLMSRPLFGPLTFAYAFALAQFAMTWILLALYMRRARYLDALSARLVSRAHAEFGE